MVEEATSMINLLHGSDYRANPFWNIDHVDNRSTQHHDTHVLLIRGYVNLASRGTGTQIRSSRLNRVEFASIQALRKVLVW